MENDSHHHLFLLQDLNDKFKFFCEVVHLQIKVISFVKLVICLGAQYYYFFLSL